MAAEAQRATCSREQTSLARAPRVVSDVTSMALAAANARDRYADSDDLAPLGIFTKVPAGHAVIAARHDSVLLRAGEVAVYLERSVELEGIVDGAVYAIEYQHPANHLPRHMWADSPGFRMTTTREIVVARRSRSRPHDDLWVAHPLRSPRPGLFICADGDYAPDVFGSKLLGRITGIYNPAAFSEAVS